MKILFYVMSFILLCYNSAVALTTIDAAVVRNEEGSGQTFVSCGFPLPAGLVTEQIIQDGTIRIIVDGSEVAANVTALRGRHRDGTVRSALIQFNATTLTNGVQVPAQVIINGGVRAENDPAYVRPTLDIVKANNVIVATSPTYLCSTFATFQNLLVEGNATAIEELQYTALAENRFDALVANPEWGSATYENSRGMFAMYQRTGDYKFHREAILHTLELLPYSTPTTPDECYAKDVSNPDRRVGINDSCGNVAEPLYPRYLSYAAAYLYTGYRDFWGLVATSVQGQLTRSPSEVESRILVSPYHPRGNYAFFYGSIAPSLYIDATIPVTTPWGLARELDYPAQTDWVISALEWGAWDMLWIPYNGGSGAIPAVGSVISQGDASASFLAASATRGFPIAKDTMPASGFIQVKKSTLVGTFTSGPLTGVSANATSGAEDDYRNGLLGMASYKDTAEDTANFQSIFPANFLIDQYLYVYADSRIPAMIERHIAPILSNLQLLAVPGTNETWGTKTYGTAYSMTNPLSDVSITSWVLPEYARILAFLIKTVGDKSVEGKLYSEWYAICVNPANNSHEISTGGLVWQWKLWGQYYGMSQDAPWIMAQESLSGPSTFVEPTQYATMIGETPEVYRTSNPSDPEDPTPTTSGSILRIGDSLLRVGDGVLRVQ